MRWGETINDVHSAHSTNAGNIDGEYSWANLANGNSGTIAADQDPPGDGTVGVDPNTRGGDDGAAFTGSGGGSTAEEYKWQGFGETVVGATDPLTNQQYTRLLGPLSAACYKGSTPVAIDFVSPTLSAL